MPADPTPAEQGRPNTINAPFNISQVNDNGIPPSRSSGTSTEQQLPSYMPKTWFELVEYSRKYLSPDILELLDKQEGARIARLRPKNRR